MSLLNELWGKEKFFPRYNKRGNFNTNAESYYKYLERVNEVLKIMAKKIDEYDGTVQEYLLQWDKNLEDFPDDVKDLLEEWVVDGTLEHIINHEIFNDKLDKTIFEQFELSTNQQLAQMTVTLTQFGADDKGLQDSYGAFVNAFEFLEGKSGRLLIPHGVFKITTNEPIRVPENIMIESSGVVQYEPTRTAPLFELRKPNISVVGGVYDGLFNGVGTYSDRSHVFDVRTNHVEFRNIRFQNIKGDGIYVGRDYDLGDNPPIATNIHVADVTYHNCKRNGFAATSARNLVLENQKVTSDNIVDWFISCGIDLEPNNTTEQFENVLIKNVYVNARLGGGAVWTIAGSGKTPSVFRNIALENIHIYLLQPKERTFVFDGGGVAEGVVIKDIRLENTTGQIFNAKDVTVDGFSVGNHPSTQLVLSYLKGKFVLRNFNGGLPLERTTPVINMTVSTAENVLFDNLKIVGNPSVKTLIISGANTLKQVFLKNSSIKGITDIQRVTDLIIVNNILDDFQQANPNVTVIEKDNIIGGAVLRSSGTSAQRPTNPPRYHQYYDTSMGLWIYWTGTTWLRLLTNEPA